LERGDKCAVGRLIYLICMMMHGLADFKFKSG
jgi:hypothetical protein